MIKVGLREANLYFSKYVKMVKGGKEIVLTERGIPIAVIKPISHEEGDPESRIRFLEEQGVLKRATKDKFPIRKPIKISGKPISEVVTEEREDRF